MDQQIENYIIDPQNVILTGRILNSFTAYIKKVYLFYSRTSDDIIETPAIAKICNILDFSIHKFLKYINSNEMNALNMAIIILYNYTHKLSIYPDLNNVKLSNSSIHESGVFASKDIKRDTILTLYPEHIVLKNGDYIFSEDESYRRKREFMLYDDYFFKTEHFTIGGMREITHNSSYLGHMINDASNSPDEETYEAEINEKANCYFYVMLCPNNTLGFLYTIATKDISMDEEILTPYGCGYWKSRNR